MGAGAPSPESDPVTPSDSKGKSEKVEEAVLPEVMKQVTGQNLGTVTSRISSIGSGSLPANSVSLDTVLDTAAEFLLSHGEAINKGNLEWKHAISGLNVSIPVSPGQLSQAVDADANAAGRLFSSLAIWGSADYSSYGNKVDGIDLDGDFFSVYIGVDGKPHPDLITGLAVAVNRSGFDYQVEGENSDGTYKVRITSANPYLSWSVSDALSLWASVGYGRGETELKEKGERTVIENGTFTTLSGGGRLQLWTSADHHGDEGTPHTALALKLDGATARFMETSVQQARLASEISRTVSTGAAQFTTAVELGVRVGSTETAGVELGGRINWLHPESGFSSVANARVLLAGGNRKEWGIGGRLRYAPSTREGSGLNMALEPSFGTTSRRIQDLWSLGEPQLAVSTNAPAARLQGELGYGFPAWSGLVTPYADFSIAEGGGRTIGTGLRYTRLPSSLAIDLRAAQETSTTGATDHSIGLVGRIEL